VIKRNVHLPFIIQGDYILLVPDKRSGHLFAGLQWNRLSQIIEEGMQKTFNRVCKMKKPN
jgi:hypothetical protein